MSFCYTCIEKEKVDMSDIDQSNKFIISILTRFIFFGNILPTIINSNKLHGRASSNGTSPKSEHVLPICVHMILHKLKEVISDRT